MLNFSNLVRIIHYFIWIMHNGKGRFYVGYGVKQVFIGQNVTHSGSVNTTTGEVTLTRTAGGACGIHASTTITRVYRLTISTTDKWEPLEKFAIEIDGVMHNFGELARPFTSYDEFGFINYSGLDENVTRTDPTPVPMDYQFFIQQVPGFFGSKDIKIHFLDPGIWFANLYVGEAAGCSITYAGDSYSFLNLMNISVNDYGAKGIGLWTLGQEDPQVFQLVPDVVPRYK